MAFEVTDNMFQASQAGNITPNIVLEIDGVTTAYSGVEILEIVKIGDFDIGTAGIYVGGGRAVIDQDNLLSFQSGTTTEIRQTLNIDKGTNESIQSMKMALIDKSYKITELISPGFIIPEILGKKCVVWLGFEGTYWKEDYIVIFRGQINEVESKAGLVTLSLEATDAKKSSTLFPKISTKLNGAINNAVTTLVVDDTTSFLTPYTGPNATVDTSLKLFVKIDDEIIRYQGFTGTSFTTCTRGSLNTTAVSHSDNASVESFYTIEGNVIDLALKMMLSGKNGPYVTDEPAASFVLVPTIGDVANSIFFSNAKLIQQYNVRAGDYITTTGASNGANNVTLKVISTVTDVEGGVYIEIAGVTFVSELATAAVVDFRSQYDVWGTNAGLAMGNDEVDIAQHIDVQNKYFASTEMQFYIKDTIDDAKTFISEEIYNPISAFSIPRKAQSSVGVHTGPIPGINIKTLNSSNVTNAKDLALIRSVNTKFFNSVVYQFEENVLDEKFTIGTVNIDGTSIARIPVGNQSLLIKSKGMREVLSGTNIALQAGNRRLRKYKYGAEHIKGIKTTFEIGFDIEVGDKVIVDMSSLKISDKVTGTREGAPRLFEVANKSLNLKTGAVSFDIEDTNFSLDVRYCLVGPASVVKSGSSSTVFVIEPSYNTSRYGNNEYKKWDNFIGAFVKVHSVDFTTSGTSYIDSISGNTITLTTSLGFTPAAGYIMELGAYANQTDDVKLVYGFQSDGDNNFSDGKMPYQMS
jgi:hypothetical protein